jgi:hypothetical protein
LGFGADKGADRLVVTEIDPLHHDEFVDDAANLARHLRALHLNLESVVAVKLVGDFFEDADKDDVFAACVLQLVQPHQHFTGMQAVSATQIFCAGALRARFGLLLGPTK